MNSEQIFAMGLGLSSPWKLEKLTFKEIPGGRSYGQMLCTTI